MTAGASPSQSTAERRQNPFATVALPFFVFSVALFGILTASWVWFLPRITAFSIGGERLPPAVMAERLQTLERELQSLPSDEEALLSATGDATERQLQVRARAAWEGIEIEPKIAAIAQQFSGTGGVVVLQEFSFDAVHRIVSVRGDVRNVGLRSIATLSRLSEALARAPFVLDYVAPEYARLSDERIGPHSPFVISFRLP